MKGISDMKFKYASALGGVMMITVIGSVFADEASPKPWKGNAELGIVKTSGNTSTQSINASAGIVYKRDRWTHNGKFELLNSSSDNVTSAERYTATGKSDYKLDELSYVFGRLDYENDRFAGFEYRTTEVIGYGRRVINRDTVTLDLEAGPGARQIKYIHGDSKNEAIGRVAAMFAWKVSDTATFTEDLSSDIGQDATISKSVTALKAQVAGNLGMKVSFTVRNVSKVPVGTNKTDRETTITLVYGF